MINQKPSYKETPVPDGFIDRLCQTLKEEIILCSQTLSENRDNLYPQLVVGG